MVEVRGTLSHVSTQAIIVNPVGSPAVRAWILPTTVITATAANPLVVGAPVVVVGQPNSDGTINAATISTVAPQPAVKKEARGTVSNVSSSSFTLVDAKGATLAVAVNDKTEIRRNDRPATLADLMPGDLVGVKYSTDGISNTALRVAAYAPKPKVMEASGIIDSVTLDAAGALASVVIKRGDGSLVMLAVSSSTQIVKENRAEPVKGAKIEARFIGDENNGFVAVAIKVSPAPKVAPAPRLVTGMVTAVDLTNPSKPTITVKPASGGDPLTIGVSAKSVILIDGVKGDLSKVVVSPPSPVKVV